MTWCFRHGRVMWQPVANGPYVIDAALVPDLNNVIEEVRGATPRAAETGPTLFDWSARQQALSN